MTSLTSLKFSLAGLALLLAPFSLSAQITVTGDVSPFDQSFWANGGNINQSGDIGLTNPGALVVEGGSLLELAFGLLAGSEDAVGHATVTGAGSRWFTSSGLQIGAIGIGTLNVEAGGMVQIGSGTGILNVGGFSQSTGTINIGNGGAAGILNLRRVTGGEGAATLNFNHTDADYYFTRDGTSAGIGVEIRGALDVNHLGSGKTTLTGDSNFNGDIRVAAGTLAFGDGSTTTQNDSANSIQVGTTNGTDGTLVVEGGSVLQGASGVVLGSSLGSNGTATVTGPGSQWSATEEFIVGFDGSGMLTVENGGLVSTGSGAVGLGLGSGEATVTGNGSRWNATEGLAVGFFENGTLNLENGGVVEVDSGNGTVGLGSEGGNGTLNIGTGGGAGIVNAAKVEGGDGTATLNFNHTDEDYYFTKDGTASGDGVAIEGDIQIAHFGNGQTTFVADNDFEGDITVVRGTMVFRNGSTTSNGPNENNNLNVGTPLNTGASALLTEGSTVNIGSSVAVRNGGSATVEDASVLSSNRGSIGGGGNGDSSVTVTGAGSQWNVTDRLEVGGELGTGKGQLNIEDGAVVTNDVGIVGNVFTNGGDVTVTGSGSQWNNQTSLEVGDFTDGTLTVADGGSVEVNSGTGIVQLGVEASGNGTLSVGDGGSAGIVNAAAVNGGSGTAAVNFNHTDSDYHFTKDGTAGGTSVDLTGSTSVRHSGPGTTTLAGNNTYSGGTEIEDGTLRLGSSTAAGSGAILIDGGTLDINGQTVNNAVSFGSSGGVLKGSGTVNASVSLTGTDQILSPGDSPGITLYGANQTWESFTYLWELNDWQSQIAGTTFDQLQIDGSLSLTGSAVDEYNLDITSLTAANELGDVANFSRIDRTWIIITTTDGITGFDEEYWSILTSQFSTQPNYFGTFSLDVVGNDLVLTYTVPEPTTGALLFAGLGYVALRRRR